MFAPSVVSLRQFYATPFGEATRQRIAQDITQLWPQAKGDSVLGLGFATPYLEPYLSEASVSACMPARQGAAYWPPGRSNLVLLAHDSDLPFSENSMNRVLLVHSVENSEHINWMMEEIWRVLTPGGRVLAIVPNRMGMWARASNNPFGYGRPFTMAQIRGLLSEHQFTLTATRAALFVPPTSWNFLWRFASKIEVLGRMFCPFLGGVWIVEAEKQVYASMKQPVYSRTAYPAQGAVAPQTIKVSS